MWPIIGQSRAVDLLKSSILHDRLAHAYLFTGPPHIGKSTLARVFAQALNCEQLAEPCGQCRACRLIAAGHHHDAPIICAGGSIDDSGDPEGTGARSGKKSASSVGIEQIRAMQREATLMPYEARYKVYTILDAENMTTEAANCLLKTLEEPPSRVILILSAADATMLLPTVVSRCQHLALRPMSKDAVEQALLDKWQLDAADADRLARISRGCIGVAINALENSRALSQRQERLSKLLEATEGSRVQRFALAEKLATEFSGNQLAARATLGLWSEWWRDLLLTKAACPEMVTNIDDMDKLRDMAGRLSLREVHAFARDLQTTMDMLEANVNARLALEALLLRMPGSGVAGMGRGW